jgi:hypothetical protein
MPFKAVLNLGGWGIPCPLGNSNRQAHFLAKRFENALPELLLAVQDDTAYPEPYRTLAACYAHMGRLVDAKKSSPDYGR